MEWNEFIDYVLNAARKVGEDFTNPTDDWAPIFIMEDADGKAHIFQVMWGDDMEKLFAQKFVATQVRQLRATRVASVLSSWLVIANADELNDDMPQPRDHPERSETLVVTFQTAEVEETYSAHIGRRENKPPTLSEFKQWDAGWLTTGNAVSPIREALLANYDEVKR